MGLPRCAYIRPSAVFRYPGHDHHLVASALISCGDLGGRAGWFLRVESLCVPPLSYEDLVSADAADKISTTSGHAVVCRSPAILAFDWACTCSGLLTTRREGGAARLAASSCRLLGDSSVVASVGRTMVAHGPSLAYAWAGHYCVRRDLEPAVTTSGRLRRSGAGPVGSAKREAAADRSAGEPSRQAWVGKSICQLDQPQLRACGVGRDRHEATRALALPRPVACETASEIRRTLSLRVYQRAPRPNL